MGLLGLAIGGIILFCLGRSSLPTQPHEIAGAGSASAPPDANQPASPIVSAPPISNVRARLFKVTGVTPTAQQYGTAVAKDATNVTYGSTLLPQTRRMQGLS